MKSVQLVLVQLLMFAGWFCFEFRAKNETILPKRHSSGINTCCDIAVW